jgi:hypothetical protein
MRILLVELLIGVSLLAIAPLRGFSGHTAGESDAQIVWTHSLSEALVQASSGNKLIIADMVVDWCGWCKLMETKTWADPLVNQQTHNYVFMKLNVEKEADGIALRKRFHINGYPTVLLLNADGSEFDRLEGFLPADRFLTELNASIANPQSLGNLRAQESKNGDDLSLSFKVGQALFSRYAFKDAQLRFEKIASQDLDNKSKLVDTALFMLALCQRSKNELPASLATLERLQSSFPDSKKLPEACLLSAELLIRSGLRDQAKAKINDFFKNFPDHKLAPKAKHLLSTIE